MHEAQPPAAPRGPQLRNRPGALRAPGLRVHLGQKVGLARAPGVAIHPGPR